MSMVDIPGVGPVLARRLRKFGVCSRTQLVSRRDLWPLLPAVAKAHVQHNVSRSVETETAVAIANELRRRLRFNGKRQTVHVAGSLAHRPKGLFVKDIDLVVESEIDGALSSVTLAGTGRAQIVDTISSGRRRLGLVVSWRLTARQSIAIQVDLFLATPSELPFALFHWRSPRRYVMRVRAHAKKRGWLLNQYGLFSRTTGRPVTGTARIKSEADLAKFIGVTVRQPTARK